MLRRLGIRSKILAVLALPVAVLVVGALIISLTAVSNYRSTSQVSQLISAAQDMRAVVEALQQERFASLKTVMSDEEDEDLENELEQSRWLTDEALNDLRGHISEINFDRLDPGIETAVETSVGVHERLPSVRQRIDDNAITDAATQSTYNDVILNDVLFASRLGELVDQRGLAQFLSGYSTVDQVIEYMKRERDVGYQVLVTRDRPDRTQRSLFELSALQESLIHESQAQLAALGTEARMPAISGALPGMRATIQTGSDLSLERLDSAEWVETIDETVEQIDPVRDEVIVLAGEEANSEADDARNQALITIVAAGLALVISITLALLVSRGIVLPLKRLTAAAGNVRDDLPRLVEQVATPGEAPDIDLAHIPVETEDEVGELAEAFNSVNETTIDVAREQAALRGSIAEMFVNVARRDQVLLNRQLSFITQLERTEEDPEQLEDLFRLDHLATRMRRNAESLLVLAGIDSGRRLRNAMPVSDVIRTASSEIEHYERIDLVLTTDPAVLGHAALTVAHLLAELMENATNFSDPGSRVEVMTAMRDGGVVVSITDSGLGLDRSQVAEANEKIRTASASDVIGAQRLGMFVVGRLARRHDVRVELYSDGEGQGTRVEVLIPMGLLDQQSVTDASHAPRQVHAESLASQTPEPVQQQAVEPPPAQQPLQPAQSPAPQQPASPVQPTLSDQNTGSLPQRGGGPSTGGLPQRAAGPMVAPPAGAAAGLAEAAASTSGFTPVIEPDSDTGALPTRQAGAAPEAPAFAPGVAAQPSESASAPDTPEERTGLFTGFRSVSENPLESLEGVDAAALSSGSEQAYVPLVAEEGDLSGVSRVRTDAPAVQAPSESQDFATTPEANVEYSYEQSSYDADPGAVPRVTQFFTRRDEFAPEQTPVDQNQNPSTWAPQDTQPQQPVPHSHAPQSSTTPGISYEAQQPHETEMRVYTGAYPTATGEYPTYTGEIPTNTGEMSEYPKRRSQRDTHEQPIVPAGDHHVEFQPDVSEQPNTFPAGSAETPLAQRRSAFAPAQGARVERASSGVTSNRGAAGQTRSSSFDESVMGSQGTEESTKRRGGLFGRKKKKGASPEPERLTRESRFPLGGPVAAASLVAQQEQEQQEQEHIAHEQSAFQQSEPQQPMTPQQQVAPQHPESRQPAQPMPSQTGHYQPTYSQFAPQQPAQPQAQMPQQQGFQTPMEHPQPPAPQQAFAPNNPMAGWQPEQQAAVSEWVAATKAWKPREMPPSAHEYQSGYDTEGQTALPQRSSGATLDDFGTAWEPEPEPTPAPPAPQQPLTSAPAAYAPHQTSWSPMNGIPGHGALDSDAAEELRRRSALTSEVLSELNQISTYQPEAQYEEPASSLARRVPGSLPGQADENMSQSQPRRRDAAEVRSMLSGFQAGVNRAHAAQQDASNTDYDGMGS